MPAVLNQRSDQIVDAPQFSFPRPHEHAAVVNDFRLSHDRLTLNTNPHINTKPFKNSRTSHEVDSIGNPTVKAGGPAKLPDKKEVPQDSVRHIERP